MSTLYRQVNARPLRSDANTPPNLREAGAPISRQPLNVSVGWPHEGLFPSAVVGALGLPVYGLFWQIAPTVLGNMMKDSDRARAKRVAEAMLKMIKLDIEGLKKAYEGRSP